MLKIATKSTFEITATKYNLALRRDFLSVPTRDRRL